MNASCGPGKFAENEMRNFADKGIKQIPAVENPKTVKMLNLSGNDIREVKESLIREYSNLEYLDVSNNRVDDLSGLGSLSRLVAVDVSENEMETIDSMQSVKSLASLVAAGNRIKDISMSSPMEILTMLDLSQNPISSLSFLRFFPGLKSLRVNGCEISRFDEIAGLKQLRIFSCEGGHVERIPAVSGSSLHKLSLKGNCIRDVSELVRFSALVDIDLSRNPISNSGCVIAGVMSSVRSVAMNDTKISKCADFARYFPNMESADFHGSLLDDMNDLLKFTRNASHLQSLDVRFTPLTTYLYGTDEGAPTIDDYNAQCPDSADARVSFRRQVLSEGSGIGRLDMIGVTAIEMASSAGKEQPVWSYIDDEEEEEEEEEDLNLSCTEIMMQAVFDESGADRDVSNKCVQVETDSEFAETVNRAREERKLRIERLQRENEQLRAEIKELRNWNPGNDDDESISEVFRAKGAYDSLTDEVDHAESSDCGEDV